MRLGLGLGLGSRARGGGASYTDLTLPQQDSIFRAWSTRRLIPAYKDGIGIRSIKPNVSPPPDYVEANHKLLPGGLLDISGSAARITAMYDQIAGTDSTSLIQSTYTGTPLIWDGNALKKGADWSDLETGIGNTLAMQDYDAALETVMLGSFSLIVWAFCGINGQSILYRRKTNGSGSYSIRTGVVASGSIVFRMADETNITVGSDIAWVNKWASFGFIVDRSSATPTYRLMFNGATIPGGTGNLPTPSAGGDNSLRIGAGSTTTNAYSVNDLAIWNKALTTAEFMAAHNAMLPYYSNLAVM
jgi:hypothetical protein